MTEIILVRHGETEWNVAEIFRGRIDIELNETGIKQAAFLAEYLGNLKIDVEIVLGLIDFNYGRWQGLSHQEVKDKYKEFYTEWISHPERVEIPAGESLDEVRKRARGVVDDVIAKYRGSVALVSHRVVNKVLICTLLGLDNSYFWNIRQDTCGITTFVYEKGRFILTKHNDTSYLKPIQKAPLSDF